METIDKIGMPQVTHYILARLADYNIGMLDWIKLLPLTGKHTLHGLCHFPKRTKPRARTFVHGYRIRASVNVVLAPPYQHMHWARIPSREYQQGWYSGEKLFSYDTLEDCAIHTLAHECFHFLSHSKQVKLKNTEANANWWADQWLMEY